MTTTVPEPTKRNPKGGNTKGVTRPGRDAQTLARELQCLELRIKGLSYMKIAKELHIALSTAYERTGAAMERLHEQVLAHADKLRSLQLQRYEGMVESLWEQATTPRAPGQIRAMEQLTRVMERIDRVGGTEAPMRKIVWVVDETTLYEATLKLESETAEMEATISRREAQKANVIEAEVIEE